MQDVRCWDMLTIGTGNARFSNRNGNDLIRMIGFLQ
jgi:hypothetical protein